MDSYQSYQRHALQRDFETFLYHRAKVFPVPNLSHTGTTTDVTVYPGITLPRLMSPQASEGSGRARHNPAQAVLQMSAAPGPQRQLPLQTTVWARLRPLPPAQQPPSALPWPTRPPADSPHLTLQGEASSNCPGRFARWVLAGAHWLHVTRAVQSWRRLRGCAQEPPGAAVCLPGACCSSRALTRAPAMDVLLVHCPYMSRS